jgi:hypothetical protein
MLLLVLPKADDALLCHRPIRKLPLAAATIKQEELLRLNCYTDWSEISEASAPPLPGIAHGRYPANRPGSRTVQATLRTASQTAGQ